MLSVRVEYEIYALVLVRIKLLESAPPALRDFADVLAPSATASDSEVIVLLDKASIVILTLLSLDELTVELPI